jgi:hypothetical protein
MGKRDRPVCDLEVTDEMIEAGADAVGHYGWGVDEPMCLSREVAVKVFEAMMAASAYGCGDGSFVRKLPCEG